MLGNSLNSRIGHTIVGMLILTTLLTAALCYQHFVNVLRAEQASRFEYIAQGVRAVVEDSLNLGLPLATLRNTQQLIDRGKAARREVEAISVFGDSGVIVFDTGTRAGEAVPATWRDEAMASRGWSEDAGGSTTVVLPVLGNDNRPIGGLALQYTQAATERKATSIMLAMSDAILQVALLGSLAALAGVWLVTRGLHRRLARQVEALEKVQLAAGAEAPAQAGRHRSFDIWAADALQRIHETENVLDHTEART